MSRPIIRTRPHRFHSPRRAGSLAVAVLLALSSVALVTAVAAAAGPTAHGPGSPEWTRHLEVEYGDRTPTGPMAHGPGSPEWTRHLELEYGL